MGHIQANVQMYQSRAITIETPACYVVSAIVVNQQKRSSQGIKETDFIEHVLVCYVSTKKELSIRILFKGQK